jgi:D5 N terminal like/Domain of unknown function (DUF3854)
MLAPLFPLHQADVEKSGLSAATIQALGFSSVMGADLGRHIGWVPPEVDSALVLPYPGEPGFCRVKVFPPYQGKDGHTNKYLQRKDSGVHVYVPPQARVLWQDPTQPLGWTEGEKKAAKACQEVLPCHGLGGLWMWLQDHEPLPLLNQIAHIDRLEWLAPDSDVWGRPDLLQAVYAFGKELESRGALVSVVALTSTAEGDKRSLDDFLTQEGRDAFNALPRLPLTHRVFAETATWWKGWKAKRRGRPAAPSASTLADLLAGVRFHASGLTFDWDTTLVFERSRRRWMAYGAREPGIWGPLTDEEMTKRIHDALNELLTAMRWTQGFGWTLVQGIERLLRGLLGRELPEPSRDWLPLRNGALHLPSLQIHPHTAARGFTWCLPFDYDPEATCPTIEAWLLQAQEQDAARVLVLKAYLKDQRAHPCKNLRFEYIGQGELRKINGLGSP